MSTSANPKTIEGVYRNGKIELLETPKDVDDEARVIVTFVPDGSIDLANRGIDEAMAANLRNRLQPSPKIGTALRWGRMMPYKRGDVVLVQLNCGSIILTLNFAHDLIRRNPGIS